MTTKYVATNAMPHALLNIFFVLKMQQLISVMHTSASASGKKLMSAKYMGRTVAQIPATSIKFIRLDPTIFQQQMSCRWCLAATVTTKISGALVPNATSENPTNVFDTAKKSAIRQHDFTAKCAPKASKMVENTKAQMPFFAVQVSEQRIKISFPPHSDFARFWENVKNRYAANAARNNIPLRRDMPPLRQNKTNSIVSARRRGNSTFAIFFEHLNGDTSAATPNPSVKLAKLLPRIFPTEMHG
jgi:hypothetical protein